MGDRAPAQLVVYRTTPVDAVAVLAFVNEWGLDTSWSSTGNVGIEKLELGVSYGDSEADIGLVQNTNLAAAAPNTAFKLWVDPKYEYPGDIEMHVPGLGSFVGYCDSDGHPYLGTDALWSLLGEIGDDQPVRVLRERIAKKSGKQWLDALEAIREADFPGKERVVVEPDYRLAAHLQPEVTDLITVDADSTAGADIRYQAVCWAEKGDFACGWCGPWRHADEYVDEAQRRNEEGSDQTDPGQLAYEAAQVDGQQHLEQEGVQPDA